MVVYLVKFGKCVCVFECWYVLGGCVNIEELWLGFKVLMVVYVISLFLFEIICELKLMEYGLSVLF